MRLTALDMLLIKATYVLTYAHQMNILCWWWTL